MISHLKKVLIIHTDGNTFNNPTLKSLVDLLTKNGCSIDLRYPEGDAPMPLEYGIRYLPFSKFIKRIKTRFFDKWMSRRLIFLSVFLENTFLYKKYDLIIGVDRQGLIEASYLHRLTKTPYVFFSFEIMFALETSAAYKELEREAARAVKTWFVQDELRAQKLQEENILDNERRFIIPLASTGIAEVSQSRLRDQLGVPHDKKVIIAIGSVSIWSLIHETLLSVETWPEDWVLIVHERYGLTSKKLAKELVRLQPLIGTKIFVSDAASVLVDDMGQILAGVDAGLAFYSPDFRTPYTGKNLQYLGFASGKISTYLRYGIPVIMNDIGEVAVEAEKYNFGFVLNSPNQLGAFLNGRDLKGMGMNAKTYFKSHLDFALYSESMWLELRNAVAPNIQRD